MVYSDSQRQGVRASGIFSYVAADGAGLLAGRIGSIVKTQRRGRIAQLQVHHSRLHYGTLVGNVNLQYAVHAGEREDNGFFAGDSPAAQPGSGTPWNHRNLFFVGQAQHPRDLLRVLRKHHSSRAALVHAGIILIKHEIFRTVEYSFWTGDFLELAQNRGVHRMG